MKGSGCGLVMNTVIGAFVGASLMTILGPGGSTGPIGSFVGAFVGAVILIALAPALPGRSAV